LARDLHQGARVAETLLMDVRQLRIPNQSAPPEQVSTPPPPAETSSALAAVLAQELVTPVFQPIVDLSSGNVVAYEALARGPQGSPLATPDALFAAARSAGLVAELDWLCRVRALEAAQVGLQAPLSAFINVEPEVAGAPVPIHLRKRLDGLGAGLRVVVEFTERALVAEPALLLAAAEWVRDRGWGIALDDVGADSHSLALMPFLRPDVIKLDLSLVQQRPDLEAAKIMSAVSAYAERTGCEVLAEGIETSAHIDLARALGARLGQGWHLGRPGPLPVPTGSPQVATRPARSIGRIERVPLGTVGRESAYDIAAEQRTPLRSSKPLLVEISKLLEEQALAIGDTAVILGAFEEERYLTSRTRRRYAELGRTLAFTGVLGAGMSTAPVPGVRGAHLVDGDPILREWHCVVVSPHFSAALVARDLGDTGPDEMRRFDYVLTHDRELVSRIAVGLMTRMMPTRRQR
jgi:EAL domain-containing protein (putative c-di-GMP-specific phosphodiesterase class I)